MRLGRRGRVALAVAAILAGVVAVFELAVRASGVHIGLHGYLAMAAGVVGVSLLAGGLMWLAFYSDRSGWDQDVNDEF